MAMELTLLDIVKDAMGIIGSIKMDEPPTNSEVQLGIRIANVMLDHWSGRRLNMRHTVTDHLALTADKYEYTIGDAGTEDWDTAKPLKIIEAFVRDGNGYDTPVKVLYTDQYVPIGSKISPSSRPEALWYDPGVSSGATVKTGAITVYPPPDTSSTYTLYIMSDKYLTEFTTDPTEVITFDPIYYEPLIYNLGVRLFRHYHEIDAQIPPDITGIANAGINALKAVNSEQVISPIDVPSTDGIGGSYNIYTDR